MLSIIIPHHNTPALLERLLKSLPWGLQPQVIVVDDASNEDNRKRVAQLVSDCGGQYYEIDRHTAGAARNEGLKHATGEWLLFADADDYYTPDAETLIRAHQEDSADIIFFDVCSAYSSDGRPAYRDLQLRRLLLRYHKEGSLDVLRALHTNPWGKMIRRSLVERHHICFEEIPSCNDAMFSVRCGIHAQDVRLDERPIYCITVNDSSMTSNVSFERFECHGQARLRVNAYLREHGMGQYQLPVLNYMLPAFRFGFRYGWKVWRDCCSNGNRPWVGIGMLFDLSLVYHHLKSLPK